MFSLCSSLVSSGTFGPCLLEGKLVGLSRCRILRRLVLLLFLLCLYLFLQEGDPLFLRFFLSVGLLFECVLECGCCSFWSLFKRLYDLVYVLIGLLW